MTKEKSPPKHIIHAGGFVFKDGKLLLGQRSMSEGHLPGYWAVPGGKVEISTGTVWNIIEKTVIDEVLEETGVVISETMQMFSNNSFTRTDGQPVIALNFICTYASGTPQLLDGTSAVKWVSKPELDGLLIESNSLLQMHMAFVLSARPPI
jgi:ADP-ribose pyrophosphatase YjhB (NUDIX family)